MEIDERNSDALYSKFRKEKKIEEERNSPVKIRSTREPGQFYIVKHAERSDLSEHDGEKYRIGVPSDPSISI